MTSRKGHKHGLRTIFAMPLAIAILSSVGLVSALMGDGWRDMISWLGLAMPILIVGWAMKARNS